MAQPALPNQPVRLLFPTFHTIVARPLLVVLLVFGYVLASAQNPGNRGLREDRFDIGRLPGEPLDTTGFGEKQAAMRKLMRKQQPRLDQLAQQMTRYELALNDIDSVLRYPANVLPYQDSALKVLVRVRDFTSTTLRDIKTMHFEWLPLQRDLMAVHTKFGELWINGRVQNELKSTILAYRALMYQMEELLGRYELLYNESEFLLNSKLN